MSRPKVLWLAPLASFAFAVAGCASIPSDRGFADVRNATAARGQALPPSTPDPGIDERRQASAKLLAQPLQLDAAITLALLNSPRIATTYAQLGLAGADVVQAGRLANPKLSASFGFPLTDGAGARFGFGIAQDFLSLLFLPARSRFARADFERAKAEAGAAVMDLAVDVARGYYGYLQARQKNDLLDAIAQAADAASAYAQALFDAGNLSRLQLDLQKAASTQAELDAEDAAAECDTARLELNRRMGLDASRAQWQIAGSLSLPIANEDEPGGLQQLAISQRLDLQAAQARLVSLKEVLAFTGSTRWLFDVQLGADYARDTDRDRSVGPSASFALPLFDQGQGRLLRAQAEVELAQAQADELRIVISNEVQTAQEHVARARRRVELLGLRLVPLRQSVVAHTQAQAKYGLVGVFDALAAKQQEYAAEQHYLMAIGDYWLARVSLGRAVGGRLQSDAQIGAAIADTDSLIAAATRQEHPGAMAMPQPSMEAMPAPSAPPSAAPAAATPHQQPEHSGAHP